MKGPVHPHVAAGRHRGELEAMTLPERLIHMAETTTDEAEPARWAAERILLLEGTLRAMLSPRGVPTVDGLRVMAREALDTPWGPPRGRDYYGREPNVPGESFSAWDEHSGRAEF